MRTANRLLVHIAACALSLAVYGCENQHPMNIPTTAMIATQGNGVLSTTAHP